MVNGTIRFMALALPELYDNEVYLAHLEMKMKILHLKCFQISKCTFWLPIFSMQTNRTIYTRRFLET